MPTVGVLGEAAARPRRHGLRRAFARLLLLSMSLGVCVLLAEVVVRLVLPQRISWMPIFAKHATKPMIAVQPLIDLVADSGETVWRVCTDDLGLRAATPGTRPRGDVDVLFLGDSFTFGFAVDHAQGFFGLLEARAGAGRRFVNGGQPAYGPQQYRLQFEHLLASGYKPRAVVVVPFTGNDIPDAMIDKDLPTTDGMLGDGLGWRHHFKASLHVYRLGARLYKALVTQSPQFRLDDSSQMRAETWQAPAVQRAYDELRRELATMRELATANGAELRVALMPVAFAVDVRGGHAPARADLDSELPMRKFLAACADADVPALDLTDALAAAPSTQGYLPFDGHLSTLGNQLVADALAAWWPALGGGEAAPKAR